MTIAPSSPDSKSLNSQLINCRLGIGKDRMHPSVCLSSADGGSPPGISVSSIGPAAAEIRLPPDHYLSTASGAEALAKEHLSAVARRAKEDQLVLPPSVHRLARATIGFELSDPTNERSAAEQRTETSNEFVVSQCRAIARNIYKHGLSGQNVLISLPRSFEFIWAFFGLLTGRRAVAVPLDFPGAEIAFEITDQNIPSLLQANLGPLPPQPPAEAPAAIFFTSGSTGIPKRHCAFTSLHLGDGR